jgi:hypothetical protein
MPRAFALAALLLALSACGETDASPGPAPPTIDERRALREAAAMIDTRPPRTPTSPLP